MKSNLKMTAVFEPCDEGGFIAFIEEISGINTQGETLEETKANLHEAAELYFEVQREETGKLIGSKNVIKERFEFA